MHRYVEEPLRRPAIGQPQHWRLFFVQQYLPKKICLYCVKSPINNMNSGRILLHVGGGKVGNRGRGKYATAGFKTALK